MYRLLLPALVCLVDVDQQFYYNYYYSCCSPCCDYCYYCDNYGYHNQTSRCSFSGCRSDRGRGAHGRYVMHPPWKSSSCESDSILACWLQQLIIIVVITTAYYHCQCYCYCYRKIHSLTFDQPASIVYFWTRCQHLRTVAITSGLVPFDQLISLLLL